MHLDDTKEPQEHTEPSETANEFGDELDPSFVSGDSAKSNKGTLSALGLVLAIGGALCFWYFRHGPQTAVAASPDAAASTTINAFLSGDAGNVKLMDQTLRETDKVVQEFRGYPGKTQVPVGDLKTNPFRLGEPVAKVVVAPPDPDEGALLRRREEERAAARKAVQSLQLQSVLRGGTRKACMINNTLYKEGDEAEGFTVEQIGPSLVVVRKGVYRFELRMTK
ncbi:MAG TPA: hypothetical protein VFC78_18695 [Tepidisphaeraceae bacterium]|nr:hypothetical protein [Tepidisphaeraceae bacterium]